MTQTDISIQRTKKGFGHAYNSNKAAPARTGPYEYCIFQAPLAFSGKTWLVEEEPELEPVEEPELEPVEAPVVVELL